MNLEPLSLRLSFMQVEVTAANTSEAQALKSGITRDYLMRVLPELDLPKAYETLIRDAFTGAATESVFSKEHRRESLIEPWALMLKLQGETALLQKQIDQNDLQVLNIAIDADTPQAWRTDGKRIVLLPAHLSVGGKDTPNEGPVTLSGVNFIEEQVSGVTLLYLPDSPDGQFLRRYDSLETARKALFNLCLHDKWVGYLAGRALQGDVRAHEIRIKQSMLKHFDALDRSRLALAGDHLVGGPPGQCSYGSPDRNSSRHLPRQRRAVHGALRTERPARLQLHKNGFWTGAFRRDRYLTLRCLDRREPGGGGLFTRRRG